MNKRHAYFSSDFKTREEGEEKFIEGYFAVFNQETELWPGCFEKIDIGAFANSIKNNDIRCLFNHESGFVLGRKAVKTLELREDSYGLYGKVRINPNDSQAQDVYARVARGDISGCSFGYIPLSEEYEEKDDGYHWTVKEADTQEVSVCTFPAYPQTEIQARRQDFESRSKTRQEQRKTGLKKKLEGLNNAKTVEASDRA